MVTIKIHLKNNLFLSREPSSNPLINTYPLDIIENKTTVVNIPCIPQNMKIWIEYL